MYVCALVLGFVVLDRCVLFRCVIVFWVFGWTGVGLLFRCALLFRCVTVQVCAVVQVCDCTGVRDVQGGDGCLGVLLCRCATVVQVCAVVNAV